MPKVLQTPNKRQGLTQTQVFWWEQGREGGDHLLCDHFHCHFNKFEYCIIYNREWTGLQHVLFSKVFPTKPLLYTAQVMMERVRK